MSKLIFCPFLTSGPMPDIPKVVNRNQGMGTKNTYLFTKSRKTDIRGHPLGPKPYYNWETPLVVYTVSIPSFMGLMCSPRGDNHYWLIQSAVFMLSRHVLQSDESMTLLVIPRYQQGKGLCPECLLGSLVLLLIKGTQVLRATPVSTSF